VKDNTKIIVSTIALVIAMGGIYWYTLGKNKNTNNNIQEDLTYVSISINPEIELFIDEQEVVTDVVNINDDAAVITSDLDLVGKNLDDAVDNIVDAAVDTGYIDEYADDNEIIVTTINDNEVKRKTLEERVTRRINRRLEQRESYAVIVTDGLNEDLKEQANKYNVSNGKMLLINKAVTLNENLKVEDLVDKSIFEIQKLIKEARRKTVNNEQLKEAKEKLKTAYQNKVKTYRDNLLENANIDTSKMTEEQKNNAAKQLLKMKKEEIKDKVKQYQESIINALENEGYMNIKEKIKEIRQKRVTR